MEGLKESFCPAAGPMSPEVQQKWGNCDRSGKIWQDTASVTRRNFDAWTDVTAPATSPGLS